MFVNKLGLLRCDTERSKSWTFVLIDFWRRQLKIQFFWDVMPCRLQQLLTFRRLDPEGKGIIIFRNMCVYQSTWRNIRHSPCDGLKCRKNKAGRQLRYIGHPDVVSNKTPERYVGDNSFWNSRTWREVYSTRWLIPWSRVLLAKPAASQLGKELSTSPGTLGFLYQHMHRIELCITRRREPFYIFHR
jgi:hypothetical protein